MNKAFLPKQAGLITLQLVNRLNYFNPNWKIHITFLVQLEIACDVSTKTEKMHATFLPKLVQSEIHMTFLPKTSPIHIKSLPNWSK